MFLPSVGTIIDNRFAILAHQGDGGMGSVFKARQLGLERVVALKWQHSSLIGDPESFARFEREGRSLAELNHPNIPVFYHFGLWHNCPYIAMEYLEGNTLREILAREKRLPWRLGINIALQVCDAMGSAHARGIIHRDLSPNNLLILNDSDAEVKIVDFGLSLNKNSAAQHLTQTGELIGSIFYMSPEQCLGRKADHRSDIYSLGCVLYEMITGVPPLIADNPIGLMHKHSNEMPIPIATVLENEPVPAGLSQTLFKAMAKDPSTRYQSMSELRDDLLLVIEGRAISTVISLQEPTAKSLGTGPGVCAAVGCLVLLATLLVLNTPKLRDASSVDGVVSPTLAAQPGKMRGSPVGLSGRVSIALATPEPERLSRCSQIISTLNRQNVESLPPNSVLQLFNRVLPDALSKHDYGRACTLAQKQVELLQDTSKRTCLLDAKIVCANTYVEAGRIEPAIKLYKSTLTELSEHHAVRGSKRMQGICCQGLATCALCKFAWSDAANYQDRNRH